jgi:S1-C subfamily serine protease
MRRLLLVLFLGFGVGIAHGDGDAHIVQKFDGTDINTSTATFTVQDKWEVLWFSPRPVDITLLAADGTVITGVHGVFKGSFYQPKGGTYYLQLNSIHPEMKAPWHLIVAEVASGTNVNGPDAGMLATNPGNPNYTPPTSVLTPGQVGQSTSDNSGAPSNSFGQRPNTQSNVVVTPPAPPATPATVVKLTEDQARAVVLIKGDKAEGTGFLIKTMDGPAVVTNIHVIANNPNLKITTNTGAFVKVLSEKGADDRDLAMLSVQDDNYSYLTMAPDISKVVQPGDDVVTPGNSQGGEVMLNTGGKVLGIGPERIEIDNPIYHGNSGGPVFHTKSSTVLGVVTEAMRVDMSNDLDKASFASRNSAISGSMRYFALRLDTVSAWIPIDSRRFQIETTFLDQFQDQSRRLDAYLNSSNKNQSENTSGGDNNGNDESKIYLNDEKIMKANDNYSERASGADTAQRLDSLKGLLFDLQCVADVNVDQIQNTDNFYSFDRERARDEMAYRKALRAELDSIGNNIQRLGSLPRTNN